MPVPDSSARPESYAHAMEILSEVVDQDAEPVEVRIGPFGFKWGPMWVERSAADDQIGWVLTVRDLQGEARVEVRVSPKARRWRARELRRGDQ